jgi:predicted RNA-binding Zn-ribbon protein involved in translation (DUF1610 family)
MLSDHARRFFEVEIRNERGGGVSPATIGSAIDSAQQVPIDVLADWMGVVPTGGESATEAAEAFNSELSRLQDRFGSRFTLRELLDLADRQPIDFTCPNCGGHELEEVQTGVVIVSGVVGRLPGERLFVYGGHDEQTNEAAPYYRCAACRHGIADDPHEMHKLLDAALHEARNGKP